MEGLRYRRGVHSCPPHTYQAQLPSCLSAQHLATQPCGAVLPGTLGGGRWVYVRSLSVTAPAMRERRATTKSYKSYKLQHASPAGHRRVRQAWAGPHLHFMKPAMRESQGPYRISADNA